MTLTEFFSSGKKIVLAFSGGTDSSYLLLAAKRAGCDITPYFVRSQFQPRFELEDAERLCRELGAELKVIELDILADENIASNPRERCYHCKRRIFSAIISRAEADGCDIVIDGTNASDDAGDRPGMRALSELGIVSPLRECGITKSDVRRLSEEAGLFTAQKPPYACLATRVRIGEPITQDKLARIETAENALSEMGYSAFRVRVSENDALLQVTNAQFDRALVQWPEIKTMLLQYFDKAELDPTARRTD